MDYPTIISHDVIARVTCETIWRENGESYQTVYYSLEHNGEYLGSLYASEYHETRETIIKRARNRVAKYQRQYHNIKWLEHWRAVYRKQGNKVAARLCGEAIENGGELPNYAWPGGYDIAYLIDGDLLCGDCATKWLLRGDGGEITADFLLDGDADCDQTCGNCYQVMKEQNIWYDDQGRTLDYDPQEDDL